MQQLIERIRFDPHHGLVLGDQAFIRQINSDFQGRLGSALAGARLQHPKFAILDGELNVLHVAVMFLERAEHASEFSVSVRH